MANVRAAFARVRRGGSFSPSSPEAGASVAVSASSATASVAVAVAAIPERQRHRQKPVAPQPVAALASRPAPAPAQCVARSRLAIILPYRDRRENLGALLAHLHPLLQRHRVDYRVFVVEQIGNYTFNKARLMNAAFLEIGKRHRFDCYLFHGIQLQTIDCRLRHFLITCFSC